VTFVGSASAVVAEEPTREACDAAVAQARVLAAALPAEDVSRYFAERDLQQALVEAGNGEFDDCLEAVARATDELRERRHTLQPGERLNVLQSNEVPPR
jgi:ATP:corrinoid adenosyltransferase